MASTRENVITFRLDESTLRAMTLVRQRDGTPFSEQIRRALRPWLQSRGAMTFAHRKADIPVMDEAMRNEARALVIEDARARALNEARTEAAWDQQQGEEWSEVQFEERCRELFDKYFEEMSQPEVKSMVKAQKRASPLKKRRSK